MNFTLDSFWSEYTDFNHKNVFVGGGKFILIIKDIHYDNSHLCNHKYYIPCTKVLGFEACIFTSKLLLLVLLKLLRVMLIQINLTRDMLSEVTYQRNRSLLTHKPVLNNIGL